MQGRRLVRLLKDTGPSAWRKSFYYHCYEHPGPHNVARHYGVVTERYKLVYFYEPAFNYWELFDLEKDPKELKRLYGASKYARIQKNLQEQLNHLPKAPKHPQPNPPQTPPKT